MENILFFIGAAFIAVCLHIVVLKAMGKMREKCESPFIWPKDSSKSTENVSSISKYEPRSKAYVKPTFSGKNDQGNFHKAMLHNRRVGAEQFQWHGQWYYTGLENLTHGKTR